MGNAMMNKKGEESGTEQTGGEVINIIITIIVSFFLIYLIVLLYNFYSDKADQQRAQSELNEMKSTLQQLTSQQPPKSYKVLYAPQWVIFNSEFSDLCEGPFCLCICKKNLCDDPSARACVATDKYVMLRGKDNRETRFLVIESPPSELKFSLINQDVYPANAGSFAVTRDWGLIDYQVMPLFYIFYKFDTEWLWSPDLEVWIKTDTSTIPSGKWASRVIEQNYAFLNSIVKPNKDSKENVLKSFAQIGAKESKGVYLIQQ